MGDRGGACVAPAERPLCLGGGGAFFSQILWPLWEGKAQDPVRNMKGHGLIPGAQRVPRRPGTQGQATPKVLRAGCWPKSVVRPLSPPHARELTPAPGPRSQGSSGPGLLTWRPWCQARKAHVPCPPPDTEKPRAGVPRSVTAEEAEPWLVGGGTGPGPAPMAPAAQHKHTSGLTSCSWSCHGTPRARPSPRPRPRAKGPPRRHLRSARRPRLLLWPRAAAANTTTPAVRAAGCGRGGGSSL